MLLTFAIALSVVASAPGAPAAPPATVEDLAWLPGRWVGEGFGGTVEEVWSAAAGGQMFGHFQLVQNGRPVLYEAEMIDSDAGALRYRMKHFGADFRPLDEKDQWETFSGGERKAGGVAFRGLGFFPEGRGRMTIRVLIQQKDGVREEVLRLRRVP